MKGRVHLIKTCMRNLICMVQNNYVNFSCRLFNCISEENGIEVHIRRKWVQIFHHGKDVIGSTVPRHGRYGMEI